VGQMPLKLDVFNADRVLIQTLERSS
jgi:hypothetical protein